MSDRLRVLVCDSIHPEGMQILRDAADVDERPDITTGEIQQVVGNYNALVVSPRRRITHDIIEEGLNLRVIGCAGARLDNIDVTTARAMGIEVLNSPSSNAVAIAEHTLTLMLQLVMQGNLESGGLAGKTLGIVGFGRIGRQVAKRALAFDMNVTVNQPRLTPELALDAGVVATDWLELLSSADFVSLHVPFREETDALIGADELREMKESAYLINTGHTDLVDDAALLHALDEGWIAGAAVPEYPQQIAGPSKDETEVVRSHPNVIVAPHVTRIIGDRRREAAVSVARQVAQLLRVQRPNETLSLEVVPIRHVMPHEAIDEKRVARLMQRLQNEAKLINPPIVTRWRDRYVILDGATRFTALKRLEYPHIIVQVVDPHRDDFDLHTWYHVISNDAPADELFALLEQIEGLRLRSLSPDEVQEAFRQNDALCYFLDRDRNAILVQTEQEEGRLMLMNELVSCYTDWGSVERTLLTDLSRLRGQHPDMKAVAIFPQFEPEIVFSMAREGRLLPAGLTRFVIPGRILRLNADLARLKADEPLVSKRAWFNQFLAEKLARSRLRYYQEPVILLDE
ncbi:MAG: NAD(P)-dependent oxidoreductase [Chloroflexota bacterium]